MIDVLGDVNDVIDGIIPIPVHSKDIDANTTVDDKESGDSNKKTMTDMTTKTTDDGKLSQDFKQHFTSFTSKAKTKLVTSTTTANQGKRGVATQSGVDTKNNTKTDDYNGSVKETNNNASVNTKANQGVTTNLQDTVTLKETTTH